MREFLRIFMILGGIILIAAGFYTLFFDGKELNFNLIVDKFVFFLAGAALIYSGIKRKNNRKT
ncbi:MAG: hypothetical protein GXO50_05160 [Chlorobi bacterium]|nr:hypothetical protein [Chlorobiota bacterium]